MATPLAAAPSRPDSRRKQRIRENADREAPQRARWRRRARYFHEEDNRYLRYLIPPGASVLELGCGIGDTLAALSPGRGVGVDFSSGMIDIARERHPGLEFHVGDIEDPATLVGLGGPFDVILVLDTLGSLDDCQAFFANLHGLCRRDTRVVFGYHSHLWQPVLRAAELLGLRMPQVAQNVMSPADIAGIAALADFDPISTERRVVCPARLLGAGRLINRFLSPLPGIRHLALRHYVVCRSLRRAHDEEPASATVVIPARNERGNIEAAVQRLPRICDDVEIIFVEGHSSDGTYEEIERVRRAYPERDIKLLRQPGKGKADASFLGLDRARGDVLMILDADLTMPPEQLPKFWDAIRSGKGEFINGSRLVYPMQDEAMRFLNLVANKLFSYAFSWLLNQRFTDTLCGTKVIRRSDYRRLRAGRAYFGDFDPFGDFDLIFGATKLSLKCADIPIRYESRTYGETQISRFRHGFLLLKMVVFAFFKVKAL
jgi:SAM-dependent methyltransferase